MHIEFVLTYMFAMQVVATQNESRFKDEHTCHKNREYEAPHKEKVDVRKPKQRLFMQTSKNSFIASKTFGL